MAKKQRVIDWLRDAYPDSEWEWDRFQKEWANLHEDWSVRLTNSPGVLERDNGELIVMVDTEAALKDVEPKSDEVSLPESITKDDVPECPVVHPMESLKKKDWEEVLKTLRGSIRLQTNDYWMDQYLGIYSRIWMWVDHLRKEEEAKQ